MFPKPKPSLKPNTYAYESEPMVKATGFREYDARWLFGSEINLMGVEALGLGLGTLMANLASSRCSSPATISAPIRPRSKWRWSTA
jgi:phosphomannomutase/phosphoglucomutase